MPVKIANALRELDFAALMAVYEEGNRENAARFYPDEELSRGIFLQEQDFYDYLTDFFREENAFYAVLEAGGTYVSALRCEPYQDGLLVEALETAPGARGRGFAGRLLREVQEFVGDTPLYSHVGKGNVPSLRVHLRCGFSQVLEHAVYIDGSVSQRAVTLRWQRKGSRLDFWAL